MLPGATVAQLQAFDVAATVCQQASDRDWLLTCIQAAYGSMDAFNSRTRELLGARQEQPGPAPTGPRPGPVPPVAIAWSALPAPRSPQRGYWRGVAVAAVAWAAVIIVVAASLTAPASATCERCAAMVASLPRDADGWVVASVGGGAAAYVVDGMARRGTGPAELAFGAEARCAAEGAMLTSIANAAEMDLVACLVGRFSGQVHIGLRQDASGEEPAGGWEWLDPRARGSLQRYTNWAPGEPSDARFPSPAGRDCAVVRGGYWQDHPCDDWEAPFVCKRYL